MCQLALRAVIAMPVWSEARSAALSVSQAAVQASVREALPAAALLAPAGATRRQPAVLLRQPVCVCVCVSVCVCLCAFGWRSLARLAACPHCDSAAENCHCGECFALFVRTRASSFKVYYRFNLFENLPHLYPFI